MSARMVLAGIGADQLRLVWQYGFYIAGPVAMLCPVRGGLKSVSHVIVSIQYLRAIAAILVVIFHYANTFGEAFVPGRFSFEVGAFGVDVFFVISGYIMYTISASRPRSPSAFLTDRIVRIVPLYWLLTFVVAFVSTDGGLSIGFDVSLNDLVKSLFFIPEWNAKYPSLVAPVLLVGWTLNLEMVFYAIFAVALFFPRHVGLIFLLLALTFMGTSRLWLAPETSPMLSLYSETLVLEFGFGILIGMVFRHESVVHWHTRRRAQARGVAGLLGCAGIALLFLPPEYLAPRGLQWGASAAMLVTGALLLEADLTKAKIPFFVLLGNASYSIYLVHLMAMPIVHSLIGFGVVQVSAALALTVQIACAVGIGVIVYLLVERPMARLLKGRRSFRSVRRVS